MLTKKYKIIKHCDCASTSFVNDNTIQIKPETIDRFKAKSFCHRSFYTCSVIVCYFILSISLTFYNQWTFKRFKLPLIVTSYHLTIKLVLSAFIRFLYKIKTGHSRLILDWKTCVRKVAPIGLSSGIDIGCSSWSLEIISISLYTLTKSTTIIFILFFAIVLGLERRSWSLFGIVIMISGGLIMFTFHSTTFDAFGFGLVLFASFISGIRWSLAQLLMQKSQLHNPVDMVYYMQPWMILSVVPVALTFEGRKVMDSFDILLTLQSTDYFSWVLILSVGAIIAFIMELSEFLTLGQTSSLTLSIVGIFKEICQLILAVEFNHDQLTGFNLIGLVLCLGGILCHAISKYYSLSNTPIIKHIDACIHRIPETDFNFKKLAHAPLLNDDDSCLSETDSQTESHSNVIYDVFKRRDMYLQ